MESGHTTLETRGEDGLAAGASHGCEEAGRQKVIAPDIHPVSGGEQDVVGEYLDAVVEPHRTSPPTASASKTARPVCS